MTREEQQQATTLESEHYRKFKIYKRVGCFVFWGMRRTDRTDLRPQ
jgi:hypothetical protein